MLPIGTVRGRLTITRYIPGNKIKLNSYQCSCECGATATASCSDFNRGHVHSCGCLKRERMATLRLTHGKSRSPEYSVWHAMKDRCNNPKGPSFKYYGARGIRVCERWNHSFEAFAEDVGPRPSPNHSLDRQDNMGDYSPENCSWQKSFVQSRNRRSTRLLSAFGKTQCISDWAVDYGLTVPCLFARLRKGITLEDALRIPLNDYAALRVATIDHDHARKAK